jgi:hypothetical protein
MRKLPTLVSFLASVVLALWTPGCSKSQDQSPRVETSIRQQNSDPISEIIAIYDNAQIPGGTGISKGSYTKVDGYLGVVFAYDPNGKLGSRRYFTFDQNFAAPADPQMITVSGKNCWHGSPHNKSSYIARFPIMGPYLQVFPSNGHGEPRKFSVVLYLTK